MEDIGKLFALLWIDSNFIRLCKSSATDNRNDLYGMAFLTPVFLTL